MRETSVIDAIRKWSSAQKKGAGVVQGIGDDCAILRPGAHEDLVFTSDFVLEGRHFTLDTHKATDVGHKALARSLSDLAAMGSEPVFCLVSLALPEHLASRWVKGFYRGFLALAEKHCITLAGGDLAQFEKVIVDVTCCGSVERGKALLRSGAKPGDAIYVTGDLGASALGLSTGRGPAWRRHLRPEPRVATGLAIRKLRASAAIDLSDGLSLDLQRLCRASHVGAELAETIPIAPDASLEQALHGGEDYELLFTANPRSIVPKTIGGLPVTRVGAITTGHPGRVRFGSRFLASKGFDHFATSQKRTGSGFEPAAVH